MTGFVIADEATKEEYEERLARYELETEPGDHRKMASWCKRNFPSKYQFHLEEYNRYLFKELVAENRNESSVSDLRKLYEKAQDLELQSEATEYLEKWGEAQFAVHAKRLKEGDLAMMEKLLVWTRKEGISQIPSAQKLAEEMIGIASDHDLARQTLNHIQVGGKWQSIIEFLADLDPKDIEKYARHTKNKILSVCLYSMG
ncbi:hypothetical protein V2O64_18750 [Verrucomicrobiaceae bacterium 227]